MSQINGLLHSDYLVSVMLVINPELKVICCQICKQAYAPDFVATHLASVHPGVLLDHNQFVKAINSIEILPSLPLVQRGLNQPIYKGLKTFKGIYWPVADVVDAALPAIESAIQSWKEEMAMVTTVEQVPQDSQATDELVLQRLNSPDPLKEHQLTTTLKEYTVPIVALLALLIQANNKGSYQLPLPEAVDDCIGILQDTLESKENTVNHSSRQNFNQGEKCL
ncbi:hypothetical protein SERLA73DRAFT_154742 [Serpula lacrymans var. lacrymans S7.3]|uniref:Uncharacterized protein n=1 Tax=Serpula lacrymans var. lacrymans (strain S7.3) TaxID=936435 RepID=F8Q5F1_SERL3|nr:hypothetical protein SERLA73DRAFT_154742 [Serpula lacrymans var. lacrymans S7.3]